MHGDNERVVSRGGKGEIIRTLFGGAVYENVIIKLSEMPEQFEKRGFRYRCFISAHGCRNEVGARAVRDLCFVYGTHTGKHVAGVVYGITLESQHHVHTSHPEIAVHNHDPLTHHGKRRGKICGNGGLTDSALERRHEYHATHSITPRIHLQLCTFYLTTVK